MNKKISNKKTKLLGIFGGASGSAGALGSFSVCHSICQGAVAILAFFGIFVAGMPFAKYFSFLEKYNILFLSVGIISLSSSIFLHTYNIKKCGHNIKTKKSILIYSILVFFLFIMIFSLINEKSSNEITTTGYTTQDYRKALESKNEENICAVPEGYSEEDWKRHMSHHPDRYEECLN